MAQVGPFQGVILKQNTAYSRSFWFGTTGQTLTVNLSKNGGAFGAAAGTVTEITNGWYKIGLTTVDTNTNGDLAYHITASSGGPLDFVDQVQATIFTDFAIAGNGRALISNNLQQNTALNPFIFPMINTMSGARQTGASVTAQRSLGAGGFASCANSVTEIGSSGIYAINLAATDLNAATVVFLFTASGCNDVIVPVTPTP